VVRLLGIIGRGAQIDDRWSLSSAVRRLRYYSIGSLARNP